MSKPGYQMYYLSLVCPDMPAQEIRQFQEWMRIHYNCRVALKSPPHITLVPPFWWAEDRESELLQVLSRFRLGRVPEIRFNGFGSFGKKVFFVSVEEDPLLTELYKRLNAYLNDHFIELKQDLTRGFTPHITIATRDMTLTAFEAACKHFSPLSFTGSCSISTLSVMKLEPSQWVTCARYSLI